MLKIIRFVFLFMTWASVFLYTIVVCLFRPRHPNNVYRMCQLMWPLGQKILGLEIQGQSMERLQLSPSIIVSNHQNNLDLLVGSWSCPERCVTLGKKSLLWMPIFGQMYWLTGNFLIDRSDKKKAWESLAKISQKLHEKKMSIWIMPEGTRSRGRGLLPFKKGAFVTAIKAGVPVIPVVFSPYHKVFDFNQWKPGEITVSVLGPIETKDMREDQAEELALRVHELMKNELERLTKKT